MCCKSSSVFFSLPHSLQSPYFMCSDFKVYKVYILRYGRSSYLFGPFVLQRDFPVSFCSALFVCSFSSETCCRQTHTAWQNIDYSFRWSIYMDHIGAESRSPFHVGSACTRHDKRVWIRYCTVYRLWDNAMAQANDDTKWSSVMLACTVYVIVYYCFLSRIHRVQ